MSWVELEDAVDEYMHRLSVECGIDEVIENIKLKLARIPVIAYCPKCHLLVHPSCLHTPVLERGETFSPVYEFSCRRCTDPEELSVTNDKFSNPLLTWCIPAVDLAPALNVYVTVKEWE